MRRSYVPVNTRNKKKKKTYNENILDRIVQYVPDKAGRIDINKVLISVFSVLLILFIGGFTVLQIISKNSDKTSSDVIGKTTPVQETKQPMEMSMVTIVPTGKIESAKASYATDELEEGEFLSRDKITLKLIYDNGTTAIVPNDQIQFPDTLNEPLNAGLNMFPLEYNNIKCVLCIVANEKEHSSIIDEHSLEYENANYKYASDKLFVALNAFNEPDDYWIAHVITKNGNIPKIRMGNDEFKSIEKLRNNEGRNKWILGINGSYYDKEYAPPAGIYINEGTVYQDEPASGDEMCILNNGALFTPPKDTSAKDLLDMGVISTIISENPVLIDNGEKCEIVTNNKNLPKTVIGMVAPGEYYIVIASNGTYTSQITFEDIQNILLERNCIYAKAMSGSTYTTMMFQCEQINEPAVNDKPMIDILTFD